MLSIFLGACCPLVCCLWRNVCLGFLPVFDWVVGFLVDELFVYFRDEALVSRIICKYFLPFYRLSFCFVYGFLSCAKACKFKSHLFLLLFLLPWKSDLRKHWYDLCKRMFSSRSFMVWWLIFKSWSHFEFIFVYDVRVCSDFIDLHVTVQLSNITCWRDWQ